MVLNLRFPYVRSRILNQQRRCSPITHFVYFIHFIDSRSYFAILWHGQFDENHEKKSISFYKISNILYMRITSRMFMFCDLFLRRSNLALNIQITRNDMKNVVVKIFSVLYILSRIFDSIYIYFKQNVSACPFMNSPSSIHRYHAYFCKLN